MQLLLFHARVVETDDSKIPGRRVEKRKTFGRTFFFLTHLYCAWHGECCEEWCEAMQAHDQISLFKVRI